MNIQSHNLSGVEIVGSPEGLSAIKQENCAAVIWQRELAPDLQNWLGELPPDGLPDMRLILKSYRIESAVLEACEKAGITDTKNRDQLVNDITNLATHFTHIISSPYLRIRLEIVDNNACHRFHVDAIRARLICTYRGTGTQLGIPSNRDEQPTDIFTVPTGTPIILRGKKWPEHPQSGLLHRSPPIEGSGETRLLLVIDPIYDLEDEV